LKRRFGLPAVVGLAAAMTLLLPGTATAVDRQPKPIPGGVQIDDQLIHVFAPGPVELGLQGRDVEPSTITDFAGFSALAYIAGTATDAHGNSYTMQTDMRVYRGTYISEDGSVLHGTFVFI
jgi:hypothetical protein